MIRTACLVLVLWTFFSSWTCFSQILTPKEYHGRCRLTNQELVVVFYHGDESLALEARYRFETAPPLGSRYTRTYSTASEPEENLPPPPDSLVWVIPLPAGATSASEPGEEVFSDLYDLTHPSPKVKYRLKTHRPQGLDRFGEDLLLGGSSPAVEESLHWKVLDGSGEVALNALHKWVEANGYGGLNEGLATDYAERGWTFALGVLKKPAGTGLLGPAAFRFPVKKVSLPLRFQADAGEFDLTLYLFSDVVLDKRPLSGWRVRGINAWENLHREAWFQGYTSLSKVDPPASFLSYLKTVAPSSASATPDRGLMFYALEANRLNGYGKTTADRKHDFVLEAKGTKHKKKAASNRRSKRRRSRTPRYFQGLRRY